MLGRKVFVTVACIGGVRIIYALLREQSLIDAIGETAVALIIAYAAIFILRQTAKNAESDKRE